MADGEASNHMDIARAMKKVAKLPTHRMATYPSRSVTLTHMSRMAKLVYWDSFHGVFG